MPTPLLIRVRAYTFQLSAPYEAGQRLSAAEAQALNALRADRIRDRLGQRIRQLEQAAGPGLLGGEALVALQAAAAKMDRDFVFRDAPGRHSTLGALDAEIWAVCEERVEQMAREAGRTLSAEEAREAAENIVDCPAVQAEARRRLSRRESVRQQTLDDLLGETAA